jgi:hypothetical protein
MKAPKKPVALPTEGRIKKRISDKIIMSIETKEVNCRQEITNISFTADEGKFINTTNIIRGVRGLGSIFTDCDSDQEFWLEKFEISLEGNAATLTRKFL